MELTMRRLRKEARMAMKNEAVDKLIAAMRQGDQIIEHAQAQAMSALRGSAMGGRVVEGGDLLGRIDAGPDIAEVRKQVEARVGKLILTLARSPEAMGGLIATLDDQDPYVRQKVAYALGVTKSPLAVDPLIAAMTDGYLGVQQTAIRALRGIKDPKAVEPLIGVAKGEVKEGNRTGAPDFRSIREDAVIALGKMKDPRAVEPLIELAMVDSGLQSRALEALGSIKDVSAIEPLIALARDEDSDYRDTAVRTLGEIPDPRSVEPLIGLLSDAQSSEWTAEEAAVSLGKIGDARTVEPLIAALQDSDSPILSQVAWALNKITGKTFLFGNQSQKKWRKWWERSKETMLKGR